MQVQDSYTDFIINRTKKLFLNHQILKLPRIGIGGRERDYMLQGGEQILIFIGL